MFEKIESKKIAVTPQKAQKFLVLNTFNRQRPIDKQWMSFLANEIREDLFLGGNIAVAYYTNGNEDIAKYLVNGQHQCNAVLIANKAIDVLYEEYDCRDSLENVALLYSRYDNNKVRSLRDITHMHAMALGITWPDRIAQLVVTGAAIKEEKRSVHKTVKVTLLEKYIDHGELITEILTENTQEKWTKESKHIARGPVIAAMLMSYEKDPVDTKTFWLNVRDGEGLRKNNPAFKLRDYLIENSQYRSGHTGQTGIVNQVSEHEMTAKCIYAWNAFRRGVSLNQFRHYANKPLPRIV